MNKLLVPFDFSVYASNALNYAVDLASQTNAQVTVFHTFQMAIAAPLGKEEGPSLTYKQAVTNKEKEEISTKIEGLLASTYTDKYYLGTNKQIQFEIIVRSGEFEETMKDHVANKPYNLIVMGTEGAFGWDDVFGGSHTSHIVKGIQANILVVPIEASYRSIKHIVYASNFDQFDEVALTELQGFNSFFDAKITCLHISNQVDQVEKDQQQLQALERKFTHSTAPIDFALVTDDQVEDALFNYARKTKADLLTVIPQEHGILGSLFHDSLTNSMAMHTDLALLVIKV